MSIGDQRGGGTRPTAAWALEQILALISHNAPGPGKQLPSERDLALQLGVSRGSVREATSALVSLGVLDPRHGSGVFVTSLEPDQLMAGLRLVLPVAGPAGVEELAAVHAILEGAAAAQAAARATSGQFDQVAHLVDEAAAAAPARHAAAADRLLHRLLAELGGNAMLASLSDALLPEEVRHAAWRVAARQSTTDALHADHRAILAALRARDPETARALAAAHAAALARLARSPEDGGAAVATGRPRRRAEAESEPAEIEAAQSAPDRRPTPEWYRDAKLGVLVHWGLYSVPGWAPLDESLVELLTDAESGPHGEEGEPDPLVAHPFSEWYQNSVAIEGSPTWNYHRATYGARPYDTFRAPFESALEGWDPRQWAELFASAGARYAVQVAKHHDGYLLWPSQRQNPNVEGWSAPRDVIGETAAAVRARGLRFGVYYSSGMDWSFANLPVRRMVDVPNSCPPSRAYADYVDAHWRELVARYDPSILWSDMGYPDGADAAELFRDYYTRVPDGIVNDRFWVGEYDVETPNYARRHELAAGVWENVRPVGISFGWNRQEGREHTLSGDQLVRLLIDVVSKNGNLILGVSPDDRGQIPPLQQRSLRALGDWLDRHGEAVYGTRPWTRAESTTLDGVPVRFVTRDGALYVHLLGEAATQTVVTGLHLPARSRVHDLTADAAVRAAPGSHGSILSLPRLAGPAPVRVLRVQPVPPTLED
jgi:alpha-L-fucosidase/DNA-binding FadR family transcriptional regulator